MLSRSRRLAVIYVGAVGIMLTLTHLTKHPPAPPPSSIERDRPDADKPSLNEHTSCLINPYRDSINRSFDTIIEEAQYWLDFKQAHLQIIAPHRNYSNHDHERFFPFEVMAPCTDLQCVGGECSQDRSKIMCGIDYLGRLDDCVIYSIGGNNFWEFEEDLLKRTRCQIHTFDCTGPRTRFEVPTNGRLHFHHICLGAVSMKGMGDNHPRCDKRHLCGDTWTLERIQSHLRHDKIDLLKLDIEGWEWPIFDIGYTNANMPMQLLMEVHYGWQGHGTRGVIHNETMSSAADIIRLQGHLLGLGYVVANRDDNYMCGHCTELTLVRVAC